MSSLSNIEDPVGAAHSRPTGATSTHQAVPSARRHHYVFPWPSPAHDALSMISAPTNQCLQVTSPSAQGRLAWWCLTLSDLSLLASSATPIMPCLWRL
ncbi:unnamed protein product, partial [Ilex paraguariensis]